MMKMDGCKPQIELQLTLKNACSNSSVSQANNSVELPLEPTKPHHNCPPAPPPLGLFCDPTEKLSKKICETDSRKAARPDAQPVSRVTRWDPWALGGWSVGGGWLVGGVSAVPATGDAPERQVPWRNRQTGGPPVADSFDRLKTALADRYAIEHELGAGGMATVYLAHDLKHKRKPHGE